MIGFFHFKQPQIVFNPRTCFNGDCTHNSQRRSQFPVPRWKRRLSVPSPAAVRRSLWPGLIEEMDMAVDDGNRWLLRMHHSRNGRDRRGLDKLSAVERVHLD